MNSYCELVHENTSITTSPILTLQSILSTAKCLQNVCEKTFYFVPSRVVFCLVHAPTKPISLAHHPSPIYFPDQGRSCLRSMLRAAITPGAGPEIGQHHDANTDKLLLFNISTRYKPFCSIWCILRGKCPGTNILFSPGGVSVQRPYHIVGHCLI